MSLIDMTLTLALALDVFFRCAAIGQLLLVAVLIGFWPLTLKRFSLLGVAVCLVSYLVLTAPIPDADYGLFRGVLLVITDAFGYWVWFAASVFFSARFTPRHWPWWLWLMLVSFGCGHIYFFGVLQGQGVLHDLSHLLLIGILLLVVYRLLRDRSDDLRDDRRRSRIWVALVVSGYGVLLALVELLPEVVRHHPWYNAINAGLICCAIVLLARQCLHFSHQPAVFEHDSLVIDANSEQSRVVPAQWQALDQRLSTFITQGGYRETGLTIKILAERLACPEHHLRQFINRILKFNNFSSYLNHYRLRDVCQQLADHSLAAVPILTLALNLGYGSIGPFNRAFKAMTGQTPSEYRRHFQNRR